MSRSFTSQLKISAKGGPPGNPNINKTYTLHSKDEAELMNHSMHFAGVQDDMISMNRAQIAADPGYQSRHVDPKAVSLTIATKTDGSDGNPAFEATVTYHGLDPQMVQQAVNAVNSRLLAVGITP